ncbi:hypothetical protein [Amphritea sp. HPY]|uniref:hypothetical protein n=1 Tax=Amphritea sp. HPY TaxID=3421652 RepID=UPI003D7E4B4B
MHNNSLKHRLRLRLIHRADNVRQNLNILLVGIGLFMLGFILLVVTEFLLQSSLAQEVIALAGLITAIIGAAVAAFGYISLSVLRIFRFLLTDNSSEQDYER